MTTITQACTPTLPPAEVNELCRRYCAGDDDALPLLVTSHLAFVTSIANRYASLGVPVEDLVSEGVLGLMEAARRFDAERGNRFLTYAVFWIRRHILDALRRDSQPIRRPRRAARRTETSAAPRTPVTRAVSMGEARMRAVDRETLHFQSLDHASGDSSEPSLSEMLEDTSAESPEKGLVRNDTRRLVWAAIDGLRPNQRLVVALRNGLGDGRRHTLREVGELMGVSRERVRQIELQAVSQLKRGLRRLNARPLPMLQIPEGGATRRPSASRSRIPRAWSPNPSPVAAGVATG